MSKKIIILIILTFFLKNNFAETPINKGKIKCIVIDAGHGGKDPGAIGYLKTKEKDITLSIAFKLGNLIKNEYPEIKVVYTRQTDVFVELYHRAKIANDNKADLFISIHCNASSKLDPFGVETFVMGVHKSSANLEVAKIENSSILLEDNFEKKYDGFKPNSVEAYIIFSLFQNIYINQSLSFASYIQDNFKNNLKFFNRGVKQAGFLVLYKTAMPSVLIETGFISNPKDEQYLKSDKGQNSIALILLNAFGKYKNQVEANNNYKIPNIGTDIFTYNQVIDPRDSMFFQKIDTSKTISKIDTNNNIHYQIPEKDTSKINDSIVEDIFFTIQFLSSNKFIKTPSSEFRGIDDAKHYFQNNQYKYITGNFLNIDDAYIYLKNVKSLGFKDAFIIAFLNGDRITLDEAKKKLKYK